jgi:transcriptional regulator with XRE-family HTH domain
LLEEFLNPLGISQVEAARRLDISLNRLNEIVLGKRGVSADTALRLAKLLKTSLSSGCVCKQTGTYIRRLSERLGGRRRESAYATTAANPLAENTTEGLHRAARATYRSASAECPAFAKIRAPSSH